MIFNALRFFLPSILLEVKSGLHGQIIRALDTSTQLFIVVNAEFKVTTLAQYK